MDSSTPPPPPEQEPTPPPAAPAATLPFEDTSREFFDGFFETLKLLITNPREAFARMEPEAGIGRPILYAVIIGWIGIIVSQVYQLLLGQSLLAMLPAEASAYQMGSSVGTALLFMILAPVFVIIGLFIWSAIVHLFLMLVGGANASFVATLRAISYAQTAQLAQVVPVCGGLIGLVWGLVLQVFGLSAAHKTTDGKAVLAVLLPIVLCCVCIAVGAMVFGIGIASLAQQQ